MNDSDFPTVIGPDAKFKGEFTFEKGAKILGDFEGSISSTGDLVIASQGAIQADIEAGNITIEGELHGNIAAQDLVELKETARLEGDLRCTRLIVGDGARFVGHCNVGNGSNERRPGFLSQPAMTPQPAPQPSPPVDDGPMGEYEMPE